MYLHTLQERDQNRPDKKNKRQIQNTTETPDNQTHELIKKQIRTPNNNTQLTHRTLLE
ncbi:hypothetical protein HanXRQr2_Chr02g0047381 [Helianthus annuus]|uniref:Uncharacterized protein n=1 Tax=Helianthus annuus TaxID=4232 RepID=A0A251STU7_HELAN|nr:hypothetical protein HanXRQr2_Chr02g0047381 [Helianthus annuus]KAJ0516415.1 hypothetical protein HanHA89_Chr11g0413611 [Helianthus annuus]